MERHHARWSVLPVALALVLLGAALIRPTPPYAGHVLYLRVSLVYPRPARGPGLGGVSWENQYWIDPARGRLVYAQALRQQGSPPLAYDATPTRLPTQPWYVITLARHADGRCAVVYTTLLNRTERGVPFACADLFALHDVATLTARMRVLARRYGATTDPGSATVHVPLPRGADPLPLIMDRFDMRYGYENLQPGVLVLAMRTGLPLSASVYRRDGKTLMEYLRTAHDVPPGALPGDFFDAPPLSLPDRAPTFYRWLHAALPWRP